MLARRFIKINRYDFYYSRVRGIAENLNAKHNFSERENNVAEVWVSWTYASSKAIQKFSMMLNRIEHPASDSPHVEAPWKERFYYIVNLLRRDSNKINKKRLINRIAERLNNLSNEKEPDSIKLKPFSYSALLETSKLNALNRETKQNEKKGKTVQWSRTAKSNYNKLNFKILMNPNPPRQLSDWDHCFHRSELGIKHLFEDSWQKSFQRCWNSIERISNYWEKRLQSANEAPDF